MHLHKQISALAFLMSSLVAFGHSDGSDRDTTKLLASDTLQPVIYPDDPSIAALDALWLEERISWLTFDADSNCLNVHAYAWDSIPVLDAAVIAAKVQRLNEQTPFDLRYNAQVQAYINVYVKQKRQVTSRVLGMAQLYYPLFEEKLDQFDIPLELKHLAVVESALNPSAKSRAGATGLWQFMYATGKMYGLQVDNYVDERRDPLQSTVAACRYLKFLHGMYGDWNLVLAAYNAGPGNVNKAIRRSGGKKDYWEISPYLPRETRSYVPAFIAANYVMNYASDHNIYPAIPQFLFAEVDTLHICRETNFGQISAVTGVPIAQIEMLNPSLKHHMVPKTDVCTVVYLPVNAVGLFLANADSLYVQPALSPEVVSTYTAPSVEVHTVRSGESLGLIAQRYGVGLTQLKEWNNLRSNNIHVGQKLQIHNAPKRSVTSQASKSPQQNSVANKDVLQKPSAELISGERYHVVQSGDTLWDIAKEYPGISANDIVKANQGVSSTSLKPGQKLRIPPAS
jgi:membrane-bound lytic murein transglycosylase D